MHLLIARFVITYSFKALPRGIIRGFIPFRACVIYDITEMENDILKRGKKGEKNHALSRENIRVKKLLDPGT